MPSKSAARCASLDASTPCAERQRKTKHAYTIYHQPYWFSLFWGVGWGCLQLYCTQESIFSASKISYVLQVNILTKCGQCFPTFSSLKRLHLNNNEGEMTTAKESNLKNISVEKPEGKKNPKNITSSFHPNMIYDSAGELHVMIQHVDQALVRQRVIQKYCSGTENRQQCRSITPQLHIVHSGVLPYGYGPYPGYITTKSPPSLSTMCCKKICIRARYTLLTLIVLKNEKENQFLRVFKVISEEGSEGGGESFNPSVIFQYQCAIHGKGPTRKKYK